MDDRRDDWRRGVDENLASLNAGQRVWDRELEIIHKQLADIDETLNGSPKEPGLLTRLSNVETELRRIHSILFMDDTGKHGLVHDVLEIQGKRGDKRELWGNITKIVVALIMSGLLIRLYLNYSKAPIADPLDAKIESAKHPRSQHVHYTIREDHSDETQ